MLFGYDLGHYWENQDIISPVIYVNQFRQVEVEGTSTFRLYKHVKLTFGFENYLNMYNMSFRIAITKIRLSSHLFYVERGRWGEKRIKHVNRHCSLCKTVEDEYHCLVECPKYSNERKGCMPEVLKNRPSMHEFVNIFKCNNEEVLKQIGLLCFKVMKKHKEDLLLV